MKQNHQRLPATMPLLSAPVSQGVGLQFLRLHPKRRIWTGAETKKPLGRLAEACQVGAVTSAIHPQATFGPLLLPDIAGLERNRSGAQKAKAITTTAIVATTTTSPPISTNSFRSIPGAQSSRGLPSFRDHADRSRSHPLFNGGRPSSWAHPRRHCAVVAQGIAGECLLFEAHKISGSSAIEHDQVDEVAVARITLSRPFTGGEGKVRVLW